MNTKLLLLLGTSLSFIPSLTFAQCVATQDCETLGYTETSCNGGKGIKCPFGNKWACVSDIATACQQEGFVFDCNNTGESGEISCGGKYKKCTCENGYEWKNQKCEKKEILTGADGNVYKCNGKVVGVKTSNMNFYVAMEDVQYTDWTSANNQCSSYRFCENIAGTMPSKDQLLTIYQNRTNSSGTGINDLIATYNGTKLQENINAYYWASTFDNNDAPYFVCIMTGDISSGWPGRDRYYKNYARAILTLY